MRFRTGFAARPRISHVVFDFDGTLSWLRHGWPEMMLNLFLEQLPGGAQEADLAVRNRLMEGILSLNGKPSIHQLRMGAEYICERGGFIEPEALLSEYQRRLDAAIVERTAAIAGEPAKRDDFVVYGARSLLERLEQHGLKLFVLSGTAEPRVKQEAALLDLARYFGPRIYGGTADAQSDKRAVISRLLRDEGLPGENLLSFGDGPVEIQICKEMGGLAVGVASDENRNGSGQIDTHKERQLTGAGADVLIPDYRDGEALLKALLGG